MKNLIGFFFLLTIASCHVGIQEDRLTAAHNPQGIGVTLMLVKNAGNIVKLQGELLEVRPDGLLINALPLKETLVQHPQLMFVPFTAMKTADFDQFKRLGFWGSNPSHLVELRSLSRFPQGLSKELLQQLVEAQRGQPVVTI